MSSEVDEEHSRALVGTCGHIVNGEAIRRGKSTRIMDYTRESLKTLRSKVHVDKKPNHLEKYLLFPGFQLIGLILLWVKYATRFLKEKVKRGYKFHHTFGLGRRYDEYAVRE